MGLGSARVGSGLLLGLNRLSVTSIWALYSLDLITTVKMFMILVPGTMLPFWLNKNNTLGSVISNGREARVSLGQVFNFKIDRFATKQFNCVAWTWPLLELKTRPMFCPLG